MLAILCFPGLLAFHFPGYLTMPQLRNSFNVEALRQVIYRSPALSCSPAWYSPQGPASGKRIKSNPSVDLPSVFLTCVPCPEMTSNT